MKVDNSVYWILDECIFESPKQFQEVQQYIKSIGDKLGNSPGTYNKLECCLASLLTARNNGFYDAKSYKVSSYASYIPLWYLNKDCLFYPFWALKHFKDQVFNYFKNSDRFFIKSDSGFKLLTGYSISKSDWDKEIGFMNLLQDDMVVISSHKDIEKEYRFWIINNEIIAESSYSWVGEAYEDVPQNIRDLVSAKVFEIPMTAYTIDLCLLKGGSYPQVVEINNIYSSGTYNCDVFKLIDALRALTIAEYNEQFD